jgi:hypothetical protein
MAGRSGPSSKAELFVQPSDRSQGPEVLLHERILMYQNGSIKEQQGPLLGVY